MSLDKCKACGAPIFWALTRAGKRMPVDAEETADGNVWLAQTERGLSAFFPAEGVDMGPGATRHKSHFATCSSASRFRKARK